MDSCGPTDSTSKESRKGRRKRRQPNRRSFPGKNTQNPNAETENQNAETENQNAKWGKKEGRSVNTMVDWIERSPLMFKTLKRK